MNRPYKIKRYETDVREPFMGNTVPLLVDVIVDEDGYILGVRVINPERITTIAKHLYDKDVQ